MRRRKQPKAIPNDEVGVDMTPMLDIVFILLIFFIVTTSFVKEKGFVVERSKSNKASAAPSGVIMIHIDANNLVYFNNKVVDLERLPARVEHYIANTQTETILFRPHVETNYQKVVEVLDQLTEFRRLKINMGVNKN